MASDKTHKFRDLNISNYALWYLAIKTYAAAIKALPFLKGHPEPPTDEVRLDLFHSRQN